MGIADDYEPFDPNRSRQADRTAYAGAHVQVLYDRQRCMHAAECGRASKDVFNAKRSPWIAPDEAADPETLERIVQRCPTGALRITTLDGTELPDPIPPANEITVCPDGPLYVRGKIRIVLADGAEHVETRVALCRCGAAQNKPFCDGAHSRARFRDAGGVNSDCASDDVQLAHDEELVITLGDNGPIIMKGPVTLRAASGRPARAANKLFLCRCGSSGNKPFCDGSHKRVGWRAIDGDGR